MHSLKLMIINLLKLAIKKIAETDDNKLATTDGMFLMKCMIKTLLKPCLN